MTALSTQKRVFNDALRGTRCGATELNEKKNKLLRFQSFGFFRIAVATLLLAAIMATFAFGLDIVLNTMSTAIFISLAATILGAAVFGTIALGWISIRDEFDDVSFRRRQGRAWRWLLLADLGLVGIFIDGAIGAWNVYQKHVLFSTAVESIPFAGVPVILMMSSYLVKWLEQLLTRK